MSFAKKKAAGDAKPRWFSRESTLKDHTVLEEVASFIACGPEHMLAIGNIAL